MLGARKIILTLIVLQMPLQAHIANAGPPGGSADLIAGNRNKGVEASASVGYYIESINNSTPGKAAANSSYAIATIEEFAGAPIAERFSSVDSFAPQPCLRRRIGGSWGDTLSFCVDSPAGPRNDSGAPDDGRPQQPSLTPEEVARILADRAIALAPAPRIRVAPARVGLTGLKSYFWLDEPAPITASAGVGGLVVTAEARPIQYVWDFGDGNDEVTSHAGRPWSARRDGNIGHMYETHGRYDLVLQQIWEARWQVGGGAWRSLGLFSNSATRPYPVRQVVPVLVPGAGSD